jgi:hypothetical protein
VSPLRFATAVQKGLDHGLLSAQSKLPSHFKSHVDRCAPCQALFFSYILGDADLRICLSQMPEGLQLPLKASEPFPFADLSEMRKQEVVQADQ